MRIMKEEEGDFSEYENYAGAVRHVGHFLDEQYLHKCIHSSFGFLTPVEFVSQWWMSRRISMQTSRCSHECSTRDVHTQGKGEKMSQVPVLCIPVDEAIQLRLHEEQYAEEYFALIERNRTHLREWMHWAAEEGSLEET